MIFSKRFSKAALERRKLWFEHHRRRPTPIEGPEGEALFALVHRSERPLLPTPIASHRLTPEFAWRVADERIAVLVALRGQVAALLRPLTRVSDCDEPEPQELLRCSDGDFRRRRNELLNAISQGQQARALLQYYDLLLAQLCPLPSPAPEVRLPASRSSLSARDDAPPPMTVEALEPIDDGLLPSSRPSSSRGNETKPGRPLTSEQAQRAELAIALVPRLARRVSHVVGRTVLSDSQLQSVGNEALVYAARRYDPSRPASFRTFAGYRVYGAMMDAVRNEGRGRYDRPLMCRDEAAPEFNPERALIAADERARLWTVVEQLEPRERALVEALYVEEDTMMAYARQLGVHTSTISRRHGQILTRLRKRLLAQDRAELAQSLNPERRIAIRTRNALRRRLPSRES